MSDRETGGQQEGLGSEAERAGQLPGASADGRVWIEADAPLRDNCTKPQRWKRPGSDQAFKGGSLSDCFEMFMCFVETGPYESSREDSYSTFCTCCQQLKKITPMVKQKLN